MTREGLLEWLDQMLAEEDMPARTLPKLITTANNLVCYEDRQDPEFMAQIEARIEGLKAMPVRPMPLD